MSKKIKASLQEIQFKILFDVPEGYSCFTEKSQDKFLEIIDQLYNVRESGNGFGCFGVKIEVETPELINLTMTKIEQIGKTILKLEKIKPPTPPRKQDQRTIVTEFEQGDRFNLDQLQHGQIIYSDDRLFQTAYLNAKFWDMRAVIERIKKRPELMAQIHDMVMPSFFGYSLYITFKQETKYTETEFREFVKQILEK